MTVLGEKKQKNLLIITQLQVSFYSYQLFVFFLLCIQVDNQHYNERKLNWLDVDDDNNDDPIHVVSKMMFICNKFFLYPFLNEWMNAWMPSKKKELLFRMFKGYT